MDPQNMQQQQEFFLPVFRRAAEECPVWAIFVPVLFAFLVVGLIAFFRRVPEFLPQSAY